VDYLGIWNERPWGSVTYTKQLREAVVAAGFKTQLVLGDGGMPPVLQSSDDADFMASFSAVGLHYPCTAKALGGQGPGLLTAGKKIWSSEDWWSEAEWGGAAGWARLFNQNFIRANITSTIAWSTIWSVYPNIDSDEGTGDSLSGDGNWGPGLIYAWEPHSGHYVTPDTVWTSAHTTQFTEVGWTLSHAASGDLAAGGSYVTMVSPDGKDVTVVIETGRATNNCYKSEPPVTATQTLQLMLTSSLAEHKNLSLWRTTQTEAFEELAPLQVTATSGAFTLTVDPNAVYTISSTTGQRKGGFPTPPPASAPFPFPYKDSFDASPDESLPRYFADQAGSFQVMPAGGGREGKVRSPKLTVAFSQSSYI
jgi:galactosylceramidase